MQSLERTLCEPKVAVAHLGEKSGAGWWKSSFFDPVGFRYLELIYPKTATVASASEAACRAQ